MLKDIRELKGDAEAYAAELQRRWTGLLSYRYIGRSHFSMNEGPEDNTVTLRRDMRNAAVGLMVAPISITAPEGGVMTDLTTVPNPVIHSCQILDPAPDVKRIEIIQTEDLKTGSRMCYSRSKIVDADDHSRVIAFVEGQGAIIGIPPEGLEKIPEDKLDIVDGPDLPPLWQAFGAERRADGHWTLPALASEFSSPDGALHIGPQHVALETAAIELAAELAGTNLLQMESWHVMFLARGKTGPFRVEGEAVRGTAGKIGVRLTLVDEGAGDARLTSASAVMRVVGAYRG